MRAFISRHTPLHSYEVKNEHFLMAFAYSMGAVFSHSVLGSTLVAFGYLSVALIGVHDQRKSN